MTETVPASVKKSWLQAASETAKRAFDMGVLEFTIAAGSFGAAFATHNGSFMRLGAIMTVAGTYWAGTYAWKHRAKLGSMLGLKGGPG